MNSGSPIMNKIFRSICEEASRRPGNNLVLNLRIVLLELIAMVREHMAYVLEQERKELKEKNGHR